MKVQYYSQPTPPPRPQPPAPPPEHDPRGHDLHNGVQIGHNVSHLAEASGILEEIGREEMLEIRGMVAREGRQTALLGENSAPHTALRTGAIGLNALVGVGAVWHGVELLHSKDTWHKLEGVSHLVLGAGCGLTAAHLGTGNHTVGHLAGHMLVAHGAAEVGLGTYRAFKGEKGLGLLQAAHGACLIGAEFIPSAALPLCVAMAAITGVQIWHHHKYPSHNGKPEKH